MCCKQTTRGKNVNENAIKQIKSAIILAAYSITTFNKPCCEINKNP